jgi:hypothetical protein
VYTDLTLPPSAGAEGGYLIKTVPMMVKIKMISSNSQQYIFENSSWIRLIEYLHQENTHMKNRLSEIIDQIINKESLGLAEQYQNRFLTKDDLYDHMLHVLSGQAIKWKELKSKPVSAISLDIKRTHKKIREQIEFIEKDHALIKQDYNTYLSSLPINGKH